MSDPIFDPAALAGAPDDGEAQHAPDPGQAPPAADPPAAPAEPTVAEIIAAELGKVTAHIDERFSEYDKKLEEGLKPAAPVEPAPQGQDWQPKSWNDFPALVEQLGEEAARRVIKERDDAAAAKDAEAAATQKQIDDHIDGQITALEKDGKLPPVVDASSPDDPGKLARQELFGFAAFIGSPNLHAAQAALDGLHLGNQRFDYNSGKILQTAGPNPGRKAPIGSSANSGGASVSAGPTYKEISSLSADQLLAKYPNGY